jgi:O-antigen ligase/Flp pilus assembly protein TadD
MKSLVVVIALVLAVWPWGSGGREPWALLITSFALLAAILVQWLKRERLQVGDRWLVALSSGLLLWSLLSTLWSVNSFQSWLWTLYLALAALAFVVVRNLAVDQQQMWLRAYVWLATGVAIYGIELFLTGTYDRLTSSFYWANPAAGWLLPALIMASWWSTRGRWYWSPVAVILGSAFLLTQSRGAFLLLLVILVIGFAASPKLRQNWRKSWLPLLVIIVLSFGLSQGVVVLKKQAFGLSTGKLSDRFAEALSGESTSGSDRLNYLKSAGQIWEHHPVSGTGAGTYGTVHPQYQQRVVSAATNAHNAYIQTLAELGLVGGLLLSGLIIWLLLGIWRGARKQPELILPAVSALALLAHSGIEIDARYPSLIVLTAVLAGIVYRHHKPLELPKIAGSFIPVAAVLVCLLAASLYQSQVWANRASIYTDNHDYLRAAQANARARHGLVYDPDVWTAEGIDYYEIAALMPGPSKYAQQAARSAQQAIRHDPEDSQHYFLLGRARRIGGDASAAIQPYQQAIHYDPYNHPEYYLDLARDYLQLGDKKAAQAVVGDALGQYTDQIVGNRNADETFAPSVAELYVIRSYQQFAGGQIAAAQDTLRHALRLDPNNVDARTLLKQGSDLIPAQ